MFFKKIDVKNVFDGMECGSVKKLWSGDSLWAEMKFCDGTCYYYVYVKGEKMGKIVKKMVREYVRMNESCGMESMVVGYRSRNNRR